MSNIIKTAALLQTKHFEFFKYGKFKIRFVFTYYLKRKNRDERKDCLDLEIN